jgi:hypothetical protein
MPAVAAAAVNTSKRRIFRMSAPIERAKRDMEDKEETLAAFML